MNINMRTRKFIKKNLRSRELFILIFMVIGISILCCCFVIINGSLIYKNTVEFDSYECQRVDSDLTDISKIGRLNNLKYLTLHSEYVDNLSEISKLHNLEVLNLSGCAELYDWSFLSDLHSLKYLVINRSTFQNNDLTNLQNLKQLKILNINGCPLTAIDNISCCHQLEELALMCPNVCSLSELKHLNNLTYLQISNMNIENIDFANNINSLKSLYFFNVQIDYRENVAIENIKELYLEYMNEIPKNFVSAFTGAEIISLYNTDIDTDLIDELTYLPYLKELYISEHAISESEMKLLENKGIKIVVCEACNNKYEISASYLSLSN